MIPSKSCIVRFKIIAELKKKKKDSYNTYILVLLKYLKNNWLQEV